MLIESVSFGILLGIMTIHSGKRGRMVITLRAIEWVILAVFVSVVAAFILNALHVRRRTSCGGVRK